MSDTVQVNVDEGVMTAMINRPEAMNAVNREVAQGIAAAIVALDSNPFGPRDLAHFFRKINAIDVAIVQSFKRLPH